MTYLEPYLYISGSVPAARWKVCKDTWTRNFCSRYYLSDYMAQIDTYNDGLSEVHAVFNFTILTSTLDNDSTKESSKTIDGSSATCS